MCNYKVSIIIPVYNEEKNLKKLFENLDNLNYLNLEFIFIDDCSVDRSSEIINLKSKVDFRYKYFKNKINSGVSHSRNNGIYFSSGDFISFLDADDFLDENFIDIMINEIKKTSTDVCYCGYNILTSTKTKPMKFAFCYNDLLFKYIVSDIRPHTASWMINKKIILNNNIYFDENLNWGEDLLFFAEILNITQNISYVDQYLTYYNKQNIDRLSDISMVKLKQDDKFFVELNKKFKPLDKDINYAINHVRLPTTFLDHMYKNIIKEKKIVDSVLINKYLKTTKKQINFKFNKYNIKIILKYIRLIFVSHLYSK